MRVLHLVRDLDVDSGGPSRSIPQLAAAQQSLGASCHLVFLDRGNQVAEISSTVASKSFPQAEIGYARKGGRLLDAWLTEQLRRDGIDLLHLHGVWDPLTKHAANWAQANRIPYVVAPRGMLEPWSLRQKAVKKMLAWWGFQRRVLRRAKALHATSELEAKNLKNLGLTQVVYISPNGILLPPEAPRVPHSSQPYRLLFLSRLHPKKGLELLVDAWQKIMPTHWECRIVGPGTPEYTLSLQQRVAAAGLADKFSFYPAADDRDKWNEYSSADLFILPTYSENFGIVVAEALGMGLPVITTTGTPWHELITRQAGWYVEPNVASISLALEAATKLSPEQRAEMGSRGQNWARETFDWANIAAKMLSFYETLLGHKCDSRQR